MVGWRWWAWGPVLAMLLLMACSSSPATERLATISQDMSTPLVSLQLTPLNATARLATEHPQYVDVNESIFGLDGHESLRT